MQKTIFTNVRTGKLPLRTFVVFEIILLMAVGGTWWLSKAKFDNNKIADTVFDKLDSTMHEMNHELLMDNKMKANEMTSWLSYPERADRAQIWKPKLDSVVWLSIAFHDYMLLCRTNLLNDMEYQKNYKAMLEGIRDSALSTQQKLFGIIQEIRRYNLQDSLIDKELNQIMINNYYTGLSLSGRLTMLTKIEHSVLESTNNIADYLSQQIACRPIVYDAFDVLIGQNTTYILPGQTLEISAGLGIYSTTVKPIVRVNGELQSLNDYGVSMYKKVITDKDKSGLLNISVSFKDPTSGQMKSKTTQLSYTVFQKSKEQLRSTKH